MTKRQFVTEMSADTLRCYLEATGHDTSQDFDDEVQELFLLGLDEGIFSLKTYQDERQGEYQSLQIEPPLPIKWGGVISKPLEQKKPHRSRSLFRIVFD